MIVQVHELDGNDNVKVVVSGMFFNDPAPPSPAGKTIVFIMQHPLESNIKSNKEKKIRPNSGGKHIKVSSGNRAL